MIIRKNRTTPTPLGRWGLAKNYKERDTKISMANHDHCGAEACQIANNITKYKIKTTTKNGSDKNI